MIHTDSTNEYTTLELAIKEIEIYLKYRVYPLIENYSGLADGAIAGSWFKDDHVDTGHVNVEYVRQMVQLRVERGF